MPLTEPECDRVREVLTEWPKVQIAVHRYETARQSLVQWITGVLARNPKLSNAITGILTLVAGFMSAWLAKPTPPPEVVHVPVPAEVRPAEKQQPAAPDRPQFRNGSPAREDR